MTSARYDAIAEFYVAEYPDRYDDTVFVSFNDLLGPVAGMRVLDAACGHGRLTRQLARQGAQVVGVDLSDVLLSKARSIEAQEPRGIDYLRVDLTLPNQPWTSKFDVVTCHFGLSDIDDLDSTLGTIASALRPGGRFVFSILHPCFSGGGEVGGSWPRDRTYRDEGWWRPTDAASTLRRQVGTNHRTLSTYFTSLLNHGFELRALEEPDPPAAWRDRQPEAFRQPVFLVASCELA
jgi:2-polyprenyl-3-methyl-5-hydroxy-6-metoxy-1,4-benzoquinol methylase